MTKQLILPKSTIESISPFSISQRHPGVQLDKLSVAGDQDSQRQALRDVCQTLRDDGLLRMLAERRRVALSQLPGRSTFPATTTGPLTLHLSRASALENAGICLHPVYGFAYLPGTGLKGMARAYAETVARAPNDEIHAVFGNERGEPDQTQQHAGAVVFHDAWPTTWPRLIVDIVNNHHPAYYGAGDGDNTHPPGDWENPVPVYFLAVEPNTTFEFLLSKRRADVDGTLLKSAREWLAGALCHLGAGAKTAAGYGSFRLAPADEQSSILKAAVVNTWEAAKGNAVREEFTCTLELVTPAFLAGASQEKDDCDLRPATLRGHLRWWWRTLHAGHVDTAMLRRLEAAIWGDTKAGGAVRITVEPHQDCKLVVVPAPFKKPGKTKEGKDKLDFDQLFAKQHDIEFAPPMTTQPLLYLAYGLDELLEEGGSKLRRRRWCIWPDARWRVRVTARAATFEARDSSKKPTERIVIPAKMCLAQASAALWLVGQFGGVGSKARKGFGSLALQEYDELSSLEACEKAAAELRVSCKLTAGSLPAESPALKAMGTLEVATPWKNPWFAVDQLGAVLHSFAQADPSTGHGKHCENKAVLGLPRQIHGPRDFKLRHQTTHRPPRHLTGPRGDRLASPVHFHLERTAAGTLVVRVVAFPTTGLKAGGEILQQLLKHFSVELGDRVKKYTARGQRWPVVPFEGAHDESTAGPGPSRPQLPKAGDIVEAVVLAERTKKGGWRAKHQATGVAGPIQNSAEVPAETKAGDTLQLRVQSANEREIAFRYPSPADQAKRRGGGKN